MNLRNLIPRIGRIPWKLRSLMTGQSPVERLYYDRVSFLNMNSSLKPLILYSALVYDYGIKRRGLSFEENNFFHSLCAKGYPIIKYDLAQAAKELGKRKANQLLYEIVIRANPDLLFMVLFEDEADFETVKLISQTTSTPTLNWFCDDHWRFDTYSRNYAPAFNWVATTDESSLQKYKACGYENALLTQWACNHYLYRPLPVEKKFDVVFIGLPYGDRRLIIKKLMAAGVKVNTWGYGWPGGKVNQGEMIKILNQSRIVLNLSNASADKKIQQIKGRDFEVPGCKTLLLTQDLPSLTKYFDIGKEIVAYKNPEDLIEKCRYFLAHNEEREQIAEAGYKRVLREHTYDHRFNDLFRKIFKVNTPETYLFKS